MSVAQRAGLAIVFCWFFFGSLGHAFAYRFFVGIVPPYIPWPGAAVIVSGIFEMLGAIGILLPATRRAAGIGLFVLTLCVTPANLYMWQHPERFPQMAPALLGARLIVQILLLACIACSTWPRAAKRPAHA
ncbi:DoxX family protein [Solimonas marina]|uniref:DoxX family protein n=1 Tax=Solimonas marina TaxID=2714601 RepID=A0A969WFA6_9GAMM|nr:hypothetical protein [Solimonas marina]NKF23685.1 hypothetical protein [Solimonas marina]